MLTRVRHNLWPSRNTPVRDSSVLGINMTFVPVPSRPQSPQLLGLCSESIELHATTHITMSSHPLCWSHLLHVHNIHIVMEKRMAAACVGSDQRVGGGQELWLLREGIIGDSRSAELEPSEALIGLHIHRIFYYDACHTILMNWSLLFRVLDLLWSIVKTPACVSWTFPGGMNFCCGYSGPQGSPEL